MRRFLFSLFCLLNCHISALADVKQSAGENPGRSNPGSSNPGSSNPGSSNPGSSKWQVEQQGFSLTLIQLGPEYVSAVFAARGLPKDVVADISTYCLFGTIIKNTSNKTLSSQLSDWRIVTSEDEEHRLKLKDEWVKQWSAKGVAFRWLLLSDQQNFDDGDWIQGFTTVALPPGQSFDLYYSWKQQGKLFNNIIRGMSCASVTQKTS